MRSLFLGARPVYRFENSTILIDQVPFTEKGVKEVLKKKLEFQLVLWASTPLVFLARGNYLVVLANYRELKQRRRRQQRERQKGDSFYWQNNNFARTSRFFVHLLAVVARPQREGA